MVVNYRVMILDFVLFIQTIIFISANVEYNMGKKIGG